MGSPLDPSAKTSRIVGQITGVLWLEPNGVYRLDGRVVPVGGNPAMGIDNSELVVPVDSGGDVGERLRGAELGVNIPKG